MQLATRFARNKSSIVARDGALTEDSMRSVVPSIFAPEAHTSRSAKYLYIPTIDIVRGLASEGYFPMSACQASPRDEGKIGHTKHMLRFRRAADIERVQTLTTRENHIVNRSQPLAEFPEIVLINSHDGTTSYQLMAGLFRLVCSNGLIVGQSFNECRVQHKGNIVNEVIESAHVVARSFQPALEAAETMKQIALAPAEARILAESAAELRFELELGEAPPVAVEKFLIPRRMADGGADLWSTFNRIQENTIRGGLHGTTRDANNRPRRVSTREVKGIDQNVRLNRALWTLAEKMAAMKK